MGVFLRAKDTHREATKTDGEADTKRRETRKRGTYSSDNRVSKANQKVSSAKSQHKSSGIPHTHSPTLRKHAHATVFFLIFYFLGNKNK